VSALGGGAGLPAGFASSGLVAGVAAGAATTTTAGGGGGAGAAAAGAAGGGISGTTLAIAGGVVVAAGAGLAVASGAGGGDGGRCCHTGTFTLEFSPFIDITVCGVGQTQISGVGFTIPSLVIAPQGNFDSAVGPTSFAGKPLRAVGFISPTSFNATVSCAAGAPNTISLSATGSNYNFSGSFTFGGRSGTWTVRVSSQ
jgi:hypothetical protein